MREGKQVADQIRSEVLSTLPEEQREPFIEALASLVYGRLGGGITGCAPAATAATER